MACPPRPGELIKLSKSRQERWVELSCPIFSTPTVLFYGRSKLSKDKLTGEWLCHELATCLVHMEPDDEDKLRVLALTSSEHPCSPQK